jgi:hypothetical protein
VKGECPFEPLPAFIDLVLIPERAVLVVELETDGAAGRVRSILGSDAFAFPTAIAIRDERLLVVNGQLDKMSRAPRLPFTVVAIGTTDG